MQSLPFSLLADLAADPANGWSIGTFGVAGEFMRDTDEPATIHRDDERIEIVTPRGAMRFAPVDDMHTVAWDSLSADGESWGHGMAICMAVPATPHRAIHALGVDAQALRPDDRTHRLFGLGGGHGAVDMALRTDDADLIAAMDRSVGTAFLGHDEIMRHVLRAQPHRVLLSPIGRIEIFQPVPPPDGKSPEGPHTHLLAKLVKKDRPHSSNVSIPEGCQSILNIHPRSPWRTLLGERHPHRPDIDTAFMPLLEKYGLAENRAVDAQLRAAISRGASPEFVAWPDARCGRTKARIVLRRMAAAGDERVAPWRALFNRTTPENIGETEEGEEA
ncbi:hypothetical protein SAMN02927924_00140 [Sphingobium faniae]|nr:hypothetical protein SAMN02927924_00140 [Sphingobium faniae]